MEVEVEKCKKVFLKNYGRNPEPKILLGILKKDIDEDFYILQTRKGIYKIHKSEILRVEPTTEVFDDGGDNK